MSEHWILIGVAVAGFFYVSGIVLAVDAVMTGRTSQGSIAWVVSLLTFPYVAVPLYWVFGRSKYYGYVDARATQLGHQSERDSGHQQQDQASNRSTSYCPRSTRW